MLGAFGRLDHCGRPTEGFGAQTVPGGLMEAGRDADRGVGEVAFPCPTERGLHVCEICLDDSVGQRLVCTAEESECRLRRIREGGGVSISNRQSLTAQVEVFLGELSDRLEKGVARLPVHTLGLEQGLAYQRIKDVEDLELVELAVRSEPADGDSGSQRETTGEHRDALQDVLFDF